ncbi:MAG TPA: hypothetical protein VFQ02_02560 [Nitrospira sp.]|nr:hypothetical protein [Nitrospira sp.]
MRFTLALALCMSAAVMMTPPAAHSVDFVADQVTRSGGHVHRGSLYYRDDMWRIEHNDPGSIEVTIGRKDKGVMWLLVGRTKQFATLPFDGSLGVTLERSMVHEIRRETIGTEMLDGHPTTLFQITVQEGQDEVIYYQWWAEDLELPLRIARKDGAWIVQFKNVKLRSLSPRLFDLPLNYRPIDSSPQRG